MKHHQFVLAALLSLGFTIGAHAAGPEWMSDFEEATAAAKESGKPILVDFTGSDWCGWCIKLDKEVFKKDAFKSYAQDNLILFEADFPRKKSQPEKIRMQNKVLKKKYGVRGFPTILLLNAEGEELARTGYRPGGPKKYVKHLKALLAQPPEGDAT